MWLDVQEKHGAVFESDTDTEVVPKLLKYVFSKIDTLSHHQPTLPELVMEVMSQLEGAFALLIKSSHYPGEMVAAKRGYALSSPVSAAQSRHRCSAMRNSQLLQWPDCFHCVMPCGAIHSYHVPQSTTVHCSGCSRIKSTIAHAG